jgi:hypothetical protein
MWATASLIHQVGCANVHIDCGATDVHFVENAYKTKGTDGGVDLTPAHKCIQQKCGQTNGGASVAPVVELAAETGLKADLVWEEGGKVDVRPHSGN